jgi:hypothetical protein
LFVNPRHAAALALVGWYLSLEGGFTVSKDCPDCAVAGDFVAGDSRPFKTEAECNKFGQGEVLEFYAVARKNDEKVIEPPTIRCSRVTPVEWTAEGLRLTVLRSDSFRS